MADRIDAAREVERAYDAYDAALGECLRERNESTLQNVKDAIARVDKARQAYYSMFGY